MDRSDSVSYQAIQRMFWACCLLLAMIALTACGSDKTYLQATAGVPEHQGQVRDPDVETPVLHPVDLADGERLSVVATTNIVADIVANVGGEYIQLTSLLPAGADPHSYEPKPDDLRSLHDADVIFINGLGLEEAMISVLESSDNSAPIISVNSAVEPIVIETSEDDETEEEGDHEEGDHEAHDHAGIDPHTWMDVSNVKRWAEIIAFGLSELDPDNRATYADNAERLLADLDTLDAEIRAKTSALPAETRKLVTDHDSLGYYARAYDFEIIGSVVSSFSTLASPSAQQLAALQEQITLENVNAIFVSTAINPRTAEQIAADSGVNVAPLYIGSLSDSDGPAATYLDFMRYNTDSIVDALKP